MPAVPIRDDVPTVNRYVEEDVVAASTKTGAIDMRGFDLCGLITPSDFTGTSVTFEASDTEGGTYVSVEDGAGNDVSVAVSASKAVNIDPKYLRAWRYLKVVSNAAANGDAGKTLKLALARI